MPAQTIIPVPNGTKAFYITAISLYPTASKVSVNWTQGTATFGATFVGPDPKYVLSDSVFGMPIIVQDGGEPPKELSIEFDFEDTMEKQHTVSEPVTAACGPAGSRRKVMVSGYGPGDEEEARPMTVTVLFQMEMRGLLR
jgi:hypothetical protein